MGEIKIYSFNIANDHQGEVSLNHLLFDMQKCHTTESGAAKSVDENMAS